MAEAITAAAVDARPIHKVPDPFPLTLVGMMAMLGPQAINFGISVGGGEAYLLPNIAARGTFHMHWPASASAGRRSSTAGVRPTPPTPTP